MTHFMKPHFLSEEQKSALEVSVGQLAIGDEKSRRIFIIALDYELTEYDKQHRRERQEPMADDSDDTLEKISAAADALSGMLQKLPENSFSKLSQQLSAADDFARQYNGRYLNALQDEIGRVSAACQTKAAAPHGRGVGKREQHLVGMIINTYRECFEKEPLEDDRELFLTLLGEIFGICRLEIKDTPEALVEASQKANP